MPIVTLTSDMGTADHYLAVLKSALQLSIPEVQIIDISHDVGAFDTRHAAFLMRNSYEHFPEGTIHLIGVNPEWKDDQHQVIVKASGQFFISADNGLFSLMLKTKRYEALDLRINEAAKESTFPMLDVFAPAAAHLANGGEMGAIGKPIESIKKNQRFLPVQEPYLIKGSVMHIDHYGNLITNVTKGIFDAVGEGRTFKIIMRTQRQSIGKIVPNYSSVAAGERLALFGSSGLLEIAINKGATGSGGGASSLFGMKVDDIVRIEFDAD